MPRNSTSIRAGTGAVTAAGVAVRLVGLSEAPGASDVPRAPDVRAAARERLGFASDCSAGADVEDDLFRGVRTGGRLESRFPISHQD